jgi:hypothetical protein
LKYVRFLIPIVLLCLAAPVFAACGYCDENTCTFSPGLNTRCYYKHFLCYSECREEFSPNCAPGFAPDESFDTEYRIVSVTVQEANAALVKQETPAIAPKKLKNKT